MVRKSFLKLLVDGKFHSLGQHAHLLHAPVGLKGAQNRSALAMRRKRSGLVADVAVDHDRANVIASVPKLAKHGGDRSGEQVDIINLKTQGGTSAAYLAAGCGWCRNDRLSGGA